MVDLGFNYRITDFQCALGTSQLRKLPSWLRRRDEIARAYDRRLARIPGVLPLETLAARTHAYHLYVVRLDPAVVGRSRARGIHRATNPASARNVPLYPRSSPSLHRNRFGYGEGLCPVAEKAYEQILSLPVYPAMTDSDVARVGDALERAASAG